jgi:hypothetical protein
MPEQLNTAETSLILTHLERMESKLDSVIEDAHKSRERLSILETARQAQDQINAQATKTSESVLARLQAVEASAIESKTKVVMIASMIGVAVSALVGWFVKTFLGGPAH